MSQTMINFMKAFATIIQIILLGIITFLAGNYYLQEQRQRADENVIRYLQWEISESHRMGLSPDPEVRKELHRLMIDRYVSR